MWPKRWVTVHSIALTGRNRQFKENVAAAEENQYLLGRVRQRRA